MCLEKWKPDLCVFLMGERTNLARVSARARALASVGGTHLLSALSDDGRAHSGSLDSVDKYEDTCTCARAAGLFVLPQTREEAQQQPLTLVRCAYMHVLSER